MTFCHFFRDYIDSLESTNAHAETSYACASDSFPVACPSLVLQPLSQGHALHDHVWHAPDIRVAMVREPSTHETR